MSLCVLAILDKELTIFEDTMEVHALKGHPYVYGEFGLRFYAAAPVITPDDQIMGTLCILDVQPRTLNPPEILRDLAGVVMEQTELPLSNLNHIEAQKAVNEALLNSEQRMVGILDTMAEGASMVDTEGRPTYTIKMTQNIFGLDEQSFMQREYNDSKWQNLRLDGSPLPQADHPTIVMLNIGLAVYDQEIGIQKADGEIFYVTINAAPLYDQRQVLIGGTCTFSDTTNRRRLMKEKDDFISIASHELKMPITSFQAAIQVMNRLKDTTRPTPVISRRTFV